MTPAQQRRLRLFIKRNGRRYIPAPLPDGVDFGETGQCFDTCILQSFTSGYEYVEGIAMRPSIYPKKFTFHAWLTDGIHAFDPTWKIETNGKLIRVAIPTQYIGIEMDRQKVVRFMRFTGNQGVLVNRHLAPQCFDDLFPSIKLSTLKV